MGGNPLGAVIFAVVTLAASTAGVEIIAMVSSHLERTWLAFDQRSASAARCPVDDLGCEIILGDGRRLPGIPSRLDFRGDAYPWAVSVLIDLSSAGGGGESDVPTPEDLCRD